MQAGQAKKVPFILRVFRFYFSKIGLIFPNFVTKLAAQLWIKPPPRKIKQNDFEFLKSSNPKQKTSQYGPHTLYSFGNGSNKVLFVHAWGGHTADFKNLIPLFEKSNYQIISFDFAGHGLSPAKDTDFNDLSLLLLEIDQEYGPFDIVTSHSAGAIISFVAFDRGFRLPKKFVALSPLGRLYEHYQNKFVDLLHMPPKVSDNLETYFKNKYGSEDFWNIYNVNSYTEKFNIPGLIIHDKDDYGVPVSEAEFLHENWKNSELKLTENLGHWRLLKDKTVLEMIEKFIEGEKRKQIKAEIKEEEFA